MRNHAAEIEKLLTRCQESGNSSNIYRDWLDYTEACLRRMPDNLASLRTTGQPAEDPADVKELFERLRQAYKPAQFHLFAQAAQVLIDSTEEYQDVIGQVYMNFANPRGWGGQFFTPFSVARMMTQVSLSGIEDLLQERLRSALQSARQADPVAAIWLETAILVGGALDDTAAYFERNVLPLLLPHFDPIKVNDCACGSGVMFVAAASCCPPYAIRYGLIQFYGQDIDYACVQMAKINSMLYGLNGYQVRMMAAASSGISPLPESPTLPDAKPVPSPWPVPASWQVPGALPPPETWPIPVQIPEPEPAVVLTNQKKPQQLTLF